ncbi:MAG TPA: hypothetical protein VHV49_10385 [Pseudonocardiaceae bacterium]|nr:hypothetical protein [Pseudonocardiaceae bacterium]
MPAIALSYPDDLVSRPPTEAGAIIAPEGPAFYPRPESDELNGHDRRGG